MPPLPLIKKKIGDNFEMLEQKVPTKQLQCNEEFRLDSLEEVWNVVIYLWFF